MFCLTGVFTIRLFFITLSLLSFAAPFSYDLMANELDGVDSQIDYSRQTTLESSEPTPLDAREQSLKFYSKGTLVNPASVPSKGTGFYRLFPKRARYYGSDDLVNLLIGAGEWMKEQYPTGERFQVGDLSQKVGGKISRHNSHQNGLDVDLSYFRMDKREQNPATAKRFDEDFVYKGRVTKNFDVERNWAFIRYFVTHAKVNRIFVDGAIKQRLCRWTEKMPNQVLRVAVLRRLRPIENHKNHIHLRLKCPIDSARCLPQKEPPVGSGC